MERVSGNQRLLRRHGVYYYRRRVPVHLAQIIGRAFVQFSLETTKLAEAKKRRALHDLKWDRQFEIAEQRLGVMAQENFGPSRTGPPLSEPEVIRLVQDYVDRRPQMANRLRARSKLPSRINPDSARHSE